MASGYVPDLQAQLVPLRGPSNFRDLGGYPAADGSTTRRGVAYRSDGLAQLTDDDLDVLASLGVAVVCDLRGPHEEEEAPTRAHEIPGAELRRLAVGDGAEQRVQIIHRIKAGELSSIGVDDMVAFYLLVLDEHAPQFGAVLAHLADPADHAVVFHCTAGKDRTGLVAALLLDVLGVPDEVIVADYVLTNEARAGRRAELRRELVGLGVDFDAFAPFFQATAPVLAGALAGLRARHGSVASYLTGPAGLDPDHLAALRAHLLVGASDAR